MKNGLVSKLNHITHPTYLIGIFGVGIIIGISSGKIILAGSILLVLLSLFLLVLKARWPSLIIFLCFGFLYGHFQAFLVNSQNFSGCFEGKIASKGKNFKNGFLYKVNSQNDFLIKTEDEKFKISDKINVCLGNSISLEETDRKYLLSQYKAREVFEANKLELIQRGSGFRNYLQKLSESSRKLSYQLFPSDQGVLAYGILFGSSNEFSREFKNDLKRSGTSHLVAVSGYNVSIITNWLFDALRSIGKNFAGVFSLVFLAAFFFMTGGSASVLRAAIMGSIILLTKFIGRKVAPLHLLFLAGTFMLALNPFAIYDWGFQLSFMATAGLFFLAPVLEARLSFLRFNKFLLKIFCETLSAQIFVLPILISNFGSFSIISPLSNLLILPLVPLLMALVFISLVSSALSLTLGLFLGGLAKIILNYFIFVIKLSSAIPISSINFQLSPIVSLFLGYLLVFVLTYALRRSHFKKLKY